MAFEPIFLPFLVQIVCVLAVAFSQRKHVSTRMNWLISSAFVTVPILYYEPLSDVGLVFMFDIVVPILFISLLITKMITINRSIAIIGIVVFLVPFSYIPLGYIFVDQSYYAYHSTILANVIYRALLIFLAVVILAQELRSADPFPVARLAAVQSLVLFALGSLQYLAGVDLVVYERIKDVENAIDLMLMGDQKILFGFGFLGLFRGAVSQMAIVAVFWWLLLIMRPGAGRRDRFLADLMFGLAVICTVGSLSRIGVGALGLVLLYAAFINRHVRVAGAIYVTAAVAFVLSRADISALLGTAFDVLADRFDPGQISGQEGSGVTRVESARALFDAIGEHWWSWVTGLGGYNPIAADDHYGVFGMHGDFLDVIARYGVIVGLAFSATVLALLVRQLDGFFSRDPERRLLARAFGAIVLGLALLALTQGTLTFTGAAGYLACAHSWMAIAYAIIVRKSLKAKEA